MRELLKFSLLTIFVLVLSSCSKKQQKEFYNGGQVKSITNLDAKGRKHGLYQEFFPSGDLRLEIMYKGGVKSGRYIEYYENGNIKQYSSYYNDSLTSCKISFWSNGNLSEVHSLKKDKVKTTTSYYESGSINKLTIWANKYFKGEEEDKYRTTYVWFDNDEYINIFKSLIPTVSSYKDTVSINEKYHLVLGMTASFMSNDFYVLTGNFNDKFEVTDSTSIEKIYPAKGDRALTLEITPTKKGLNVFRCLICNYKSDEDKLKVRNIPIEKTYYVE